MFQEENILNNENVVSQNSSALFKIAILTMSMVQNGTNGISPILAQIAAAFPDASNTSIQFLMTFPSIFCMVFALVSAFMAEKLPKKTLAVAGLTIVCAGGFLAFLFHGSLLVLYVWAGVIGLGLGMVAPIAPSLVNSTYKGDEMNTMLGWQNSANNIGSMLMTFVGGFLAVAGWNFGYLVYFIAVPGIIFTLIGLRSSKKTNIQNPEPVVNKENRGPFRLVIWRDLIIVCIFLMVYSAVPVNMSMLIEEYGLGGSSLSGTMSTIFLLAGTLMGIVFGRFARIFKQFTNTAGALAMAIGATLMGLSSNLVVIIIGCLVSGISMTIVMPSCMASGSKLKGYETINTAMIMAASYVGVFITPLITSATAAITGSDKTSYRFISIGIISFALVIITLVLKIGTNKKAEK